MLFVSLGCRLYTCEMIEHLRGSISGRCLKTSRSWIGIIQMHLVGSANRFHAMFPSPSVNNIDLRDFIRVGMPSTHSDTSIGILAWHHLISRYGINRFAYWNRCTHCMRPFWLSIIITQVLFCFYGQTNTRRFSPATICTASIARFQSSTEWNMRRFSPATICTASIARFQSSTEWTRCTCCETKRQIIQRTCNG